LISYRVIIELMAEYPEGWSSKIVGHFFARQISRMKGLD
jgi:hypothetical protein